MAVSPPGESPFADERELRADVHAAVEHALDRVLYGRDREITDVEAEKLAYLVVDEFDLDLTYSWYIAGTCTAIGPVSTGRQDPGGPTEPSQIASADLTPSSDVTAEADDDRTQKFTDYLASETLFGNYKLRDVWYTKRHEFLSDFYEAHAPERYTDAYLAATEIRRHLMMLTDGGNPSKSGESEQTLLDAETEETFRYTVSDLHLALARDDRLSETTAVVTEGTNLIERTLDRLTRVKPSTNEQWKLMRELSEFFFYKVWRLPALVISTRTAQGPNADTLQAQHEQELEGFVNDVRRRRDQLHQRLRTANLLPTIEEDRSSDIGLKYGISLSTE